MKIHALLLLPALALSATAQAATESTSGFDTVSLSLGGGAAYAPRYPGSKEYHALPMFNATVLFKNGFFADGNQGAGYRFKFTDDLYATAALSVDPGRKDKNDVLVPGADHLRGMGRIKTSALTNLGLGYRFGERINLGVVVSKPVNHAGYGASAQLFGHLAVWKGERDDIDLDTVVHYGNRNYNRTWFGVSTAQAARTGFAPYVPAAGIYAVDAGATWSHQFGAHWFTRVSSGATRYMQRVSDGAVVQKRTGYVATASLNYRF